MLKSLFIGSFLAAAALVSATPLPGDHPAAAPAPAPAPTPAMAPAPNNATQAKRDFHLPPKVRTLVKVRQEHPAAQNATGAAAAAAAGHPTVKRGAGPGMNMNMTAGGGAEAAHPPPALH